MPAEVGEQLASCALAASFAYARTAHSAATMESGASTPRHSIHEAVIRRDARAIAQNHEIRNSYEISYNAVTFVM